MKNSSRLVAGDAEELHALEQRMRWVARLGEHALVELQPAQLAIDVERRILEVRPDPCAGISVDLGGAGCGRRLSLGSIRRSAGRRSDSVWAVHRLVWDSPSEGAGSYQSDVTLLGLSTQL